MITCPDIPGRGVIALSTKAINLIAIPMPKHDSFVFIKLDSMFDLLSACLDSISLHIYLFDCSFPDSQKGLKSGKFSLSKLLIGMFWIIRVYTSEPPRWATIQVTSL